MKIGISAIVPLSLYDKNLYSSFKSAIEKNKDKVTEIIIVNDEQPSEINFGGNIKFVRTMSKGASVVFNKGVSNCCCEYYFFMIPSIILKEGIEKEIVSSDKKGTKTGMFFSDYISLADGKEKNQPLFDFNGDFTERFNFGFVEIYKKSVWEKMGKYNIDYSTDVGCVYDYKLQLQQNGYKFVRIPKQLYTVIEDKTTSELFSAFRYLSYSPQEEKEVEFAFYNFLRNENAFLSHKNRKIVYPKGIKFNPLISIVSPTYNREKWVGKAIDTVLQNTFKNWELIFVDNASTDKTVDVIQKYAQKDNRIRIIRLEKYHDGAISFCLNTGIKSARGKYYAQMDSDDEYSKYTLEEIADYMESNPDVALAISYYDLIDENSNPIENIGVIKHLEYNRNNILRVEGAGALRVWHRKVMQEFGYFNETDFGSYGEDYDLVLKTSELYNVGRLHSILYRYRRHSEVTDVLRDPKTKVWNKVYARILALSRRKKINQLLLKTKTNDLNKVPKTKIEKIYKS